MTRDPNQTMLVEMTVVEARRVAKILMTHYARQLVDASTYLRQARHDKIKAEEYRAIEEIAACETLLETALRFREASK